MSVHKLGRTVHRSTTQPCDGQRKIKTSDVRKRIPYNHGIPRISRDNSLTRFGLLARVFTIELIEWGQDHFGQLTTPASGAYLEAAQDALNIEPDDQSDDEIDNTKELQIEEALKLYQTALKLHSQGPQHYAQAAEAYRNLFKSEIFRYPESVTEFIRYEEHPELELADEAIPLDLDIAVGVDGIPSTLPQILYLSYKNHGHFVLDALKYNIKRRDAELVLGRAVINDECQGALNDFSLAIASDESDTELWRRAARIAASLGSRRVMRYCLEAAVEVDDDPTIAEVEPPSLEEGFAGEQLKEVLEVLGDEMALSHPIMGPFLRKRLPVYLTKHLDLYPFLEDPTKILEPAPSKTGDQELSPTRSTIEVPQYTWTSLGDALCHVLLSSEGSSAGGISIHLPEEDDINVMDNTEPQAPIEDQIMKDVTRTESPDQVGAGISLPITTSSEDRPVEIVTTTTIVPIKDASPDKEIALPTRKRSQSTAGIRETPEEDNSTQKRSKRIRNRDSTTEGLDSAVQFLEQLKPFVEADEHLFGFVGGALKKLGIENLGTLESLQAAISSEGTPATEEAPSSTTTLRDLRDILRSWDDSKASTFLNANAADILGSSAGSANAGLAAFLENSNTGPQKLSTLPLFSATEGLSAFKQKVNENWLPLQDVLFDWLCYVLGTYQHSLWPEDLKVCVVHVISYFHSDIFDRFQMKTENMSHLEVGNHSRRRTEDIIQTLFELHLDIYSRITNPNSIVNYETRIMTKERLDRWAEFCADVIGSHAQDAADELSLRYLWASVFYATMAEGVSREHKVLCWSDMKALLLEANNPVILLQNNAVIPEISAAAAEREVSRLTTMDFFFNLFQADKTDPLVIIETLEPVLDPESACQPSESELEEVETASDVPVDNTPESLRDMWKFLKGGSTSLRLFLWQRLREAYLSIGYTTKVFSCHLKCIEIIVNDLQSDDYIESTEEPRRHKLLMWLKALDDLLVKSLGLALNDAETCFEIIDDRHIKSTCAAIAKLSRILHVAAIFEDEVRVGMFQLPQTPAYAPQGTFDSFTLKLREMQIRSWSLQYTLVKEGMNQNREIFPDMDRDQADFLATVHYAIGLRKYCKVSNKIFLKMMKVEMLRLKHVEKWEDYIGQVLFDLYAIRLGVETYLLEDHGCPNEALDRRTVLNIVPQVIALANRLSMKDLLKHELRSTIEKMQQAIGPAKSNPQMQHNLRNYTEYLKTSIRPLHMYQALKGQVQVDSLPVISHESPLANKGWYFLLGMMALTKFRSQKRLGPGAQTDDLRVGATFLRLQLQFTADHWETWYRLAQCFDYELEEEILWSAEKINNNRAELVKLQRSAIHCYVMALSTAVRNADDTFETAGKLSEMYQDFGMRVYSSSREPFSMEAFWVDEFEKHMSGAAGMYKKPLHEELSRFKAWKYASTLFKRALADKPNSWMNHFMLGKCQWKMYCKALQDVDDRIKAQRPEMQAVLNCFLNAIKTVPKPKDSRQDPILEPHYKLVSIVHKLVMFGHLKPQEGANHLQQQPYAIRKGEYVGINDFEDWEPFILESLRHLRNADKQHWHHRMIARVASILFDENRPEYVQAMAAKHEFRESIFTKTMHVQVWKPDAERPGRHCVYMERYVKFMTKILWVVNDKANMELLAKRVRKKSTDYFCFNQVWTEVCSTYLKLIRRAGQIPPNMDEVFKGMPYDEFEVYSDRLTEWIQDPKSTIPALDALRESVELKKLNANQMKATAIDDIINDAWAVLITQIAKTLPGPDPATQLQLDGEAAARVQGPMSVSNLVMTLDGTPVVVPVAGPETGPRPRKIGVGRREVLRRAEGAVNKSADAPKSSGISRGRYSEPGSARPVDPVGPVQKPKGFNIGRNLDDGKGDESSAPGSVHDSADDESDLSDVPDMDESMIFPNLVKRDEESSANRGTAGGSSGGEGASTPVENSEHQ
ncbi:hypothetical protein B7463_g6002, partial [Scytalidium lignicola]